LIGGIKGLFKGATGLIINPIAGVLDAASLSAQGIKTQTLSKDEKPN